MRHYFFCISIILSCILTFIPSSAQGREDLRLKTVVIDAGHGGHDPGCRSKDGKVLEKNLTLLISKQLGQKIRSEYPDVKVVYTRTTDKYLTLNERADIANRSHADLFISIHINAVPQTSPNGFSVFILGKYNKKGTDMFDANAEVCRRENSVIMLEDDYVSKYNGFDPNDPESFIFFHLLQNANFEQSLQFASDIDRQFKKGPFAGNRGIYQDVFYVLWKTAMPAVLVEAGFISNTADLKVMNSTAGQQKIVQNLFDAFKNFKKNYDSSMSGGGTSRKETGETVETKPQPVAEVSSIGIQILALSRNLRPGDPILKGYSPKIYRSGNIFKYVIIVEGEKSAAEAELKRVKRDFPDSFLVRVKEGTVTRY